MRHGLTLAVLGITVFAAAFAVTSAKTAASADSAFGGLNRGRARRARLCDHADRTHGHAAHGVLFAPPAESEPASPGRHHRDPRRRAGLRATTADITGNRLHLKIVRLPHARLARALDTAAFVAMENNDAARAGLQPARDSIGIEDARSPYADVSPYATPTARSRGRTSSWRRITRTTLRISSSRATRTRCGGHGRA
jgi:hypothetical protein